MFKLEWNDGKLVNSMDLLNKKENSEGNSSPSTTLANKEKEKRIDKCLRCPSLHRNSSCFAKEIVTGKNISREDLMDSTLFLNTTMGENRGVVDFGPLQMISSFEEYEARVTVLSGVFSI